MRKEAEVKSKILILGILTFLLFVAMDFSFISAAPGNLTIRQNVTQDYDEGTFFVNWTNAENDGAVNHTIFVFANTSTYSSIFNVTVNNTNTGFSFTNTTQANYTFIVRAANATNMYNSSNISIFVDRTAPTITLPAYVNATLKKNTENLILNISVIDAASGTTGSVCLIDVNGTSNQTVAFSGGWCNTTTLSLAGSSDGNTTLKVYVNDTVGILGLNNSFAVLIDTTAPTATFSNYTNGTFKRNTDNLTLNLSVSDATSGLTSGVCIFNVNGTNRSVSISSGWCNSSDITLSGLSDGNKTINVYINDSANNVRLNNSYVVQIDTTSPTASPSCSPTTVQTGASFPCTCGGSDSGSGINSSATSSSSNSPDGTSTPSSTGTFTFTCSVTDNVGNTASGNTIYYVTQGAGGSSSGGGGGSTTSFWTAGTYSITEDQFVEGHSMEVLSKQRVKIVISNEDHYVGVKSLDASSALISISSDPQERTLSIGEEWKVEVTEDDYYDLSVKLTAIENNKAVIFVKSIHEAVPQENLLVEEQAQEVEDTSPTLTGEAIGDEGAVEKGSSNIWMWLILGVIVVVLVVWFVAHSKKRS